MLSCLRQVPAWFPFCLRDGFSDFRHGCGFCWRNRRFVSSLSFSPGLSPGLSPPRSPRLSQRVSHLLDDILEIEAAAQHHHSPLTWWAWASSSCPAFRNLRASGGASSFRGISVGLLCSNSSAKHGMSQTWLDHINTRKHHTLYRSDQQVSSYSSCLYIIFLRIAVWSFSMCYFRRCWFESNFC